MSRSVAVVAHTHWDREWYAPFESYRAELLDVLDEVLDRLAPGGDLPHFHLDGQVAALDDYLERRPGRRSEVQAHVAAGRLSVGPWYVLMDEFCVSGETMVRNLQLGLARVGALGAPGPEVGYLPDMFGHVAQMPALLRAAGIDHAVVWRGVPEAVAATAFWWEAPGGDAVRAEYLPAGYANGAFLPADGAALDRRVAAHEREIERLLRPGWPLLLMCGGDHQRPPAQLAERLQAATEASRPAGRGTPAREYRLTTLADHLASAPTDGLGAWRGELRSAHRAPVLAGVLSNRVDVKAAAARAERMLEKVAEPLAALWLPAELWPGAALEQAWLEMVRNSAHDSVCACSADEVGRAVLHRYETATGLARAAVEGASELAACATAAAGPLLVNPLPRSRSEVVEAVLAGADCPAGLQPLRTAAAGIERRRATGAELGAVLGALAADGWLGPGGGATRAALRCDEASVELDIEVDPAARPDPAMAATVAEAWAAAGAAPDGPLTVTVRRAAHQRVAGFSPEVPGFGWATGPTPLPRPAGVAPVTVDGTAVDNGLVRMVVDPADGTFSLDGVPGQNRLVEEGDAGDTYNFAPDPDRPPLDRPGRVTVAVEESGPIRARVVVGREYPWAGGAPTWVTSTLEVRAGEPVVRVETTLDHHGRDHRLRALFPLARPADRSRAECAFAVVERGRRGEGGPREPAVATFPSRRFVSAGGLTVVHEGLLEYELVDGGAALAVTLLRAVGVLSRPTLATRPNTAGPPLALRDAQLPGPVGVRYAVLPRCPDPYPWADRMWTPLVQVTAAGGGPLADCGSRLAVEAGPAQVSALRRVDGELELRLFNPTGHPVAVFVAGHSGRLVDLRGGPAGTWAERIDLAPAAVVTARLDRRTLDP